MIGRRFGLVTVLARDGRASRGNPVWFAVCDCGRGRWFQTSNLQKRPPKTHRFCHRGVAPEKVALQLDLDLDDVQEQAYKDGTTQPLESA